MMANEYDAEAMERFYKTLKIAMKNEALLMVMDTLIKMAELMTEKGDKERAVEILTIVLQYPLRQASKIRAETLYNELEAELCARVMLDAQNLAQELTLDDLLQAIIGTEAG